MNSEEIEILLNYFSEDATAGELAWSEFTGRDELRTWLEDFSKSKYVHKISGLEVSGDDVTFYWRRTKGGTSYLCICKVTFRDQEIIYLMASKCST